MSSLQRKIASHYLLTPQGFQPRPLITIRVSGGSHEIVAVEQYGEGLDSMAGVEFHSGILCAGFINAHSHLELAYLRGAIEAGGGFANFAASVGKVRNNFSDEDKLAAIAEADKAMWREGVDAVGDIVNDAISFAVKSSSDIEKIMN